MSSNEVISDEDKAFMAKCEEELKHRYTENDQEFIKIFNADASKPPIVECWYPQNQGRRNDRRHQRYMPYERHDNRNRGYQDRSYNNRYNDRGYRDYDSGNNRGRYNRSHY